MAFRLDDIRSDLRRGVARTSHYEMLVGNRGVTLRAISVTAPGRQITATPSGVYGAIQEIGYGTIYSPISAQVFCSPDHNERLFFTEWQDQIVGPHRALASLGGNPDSSFDAGYYKDYVDTVTIVQYDDTGSKKHEIKLQEAYPRNVGELSYSYQSSELLLFTVSFQYRYFTEQSS